MCVLPCYIVAWGGTDSSLADEEIGIIAPYRAQVRKIRMALTQFASDVKVASVEEFQGQVRSLPCCHRRLSVHACSSGAEGYHTLYSAEYPRPTPIRPALHSGLCRESAEVQWSVYADTLSCEESILFNGLCTVAITRAKALLIVIGNASVLSTDPLWRRFLNYVSLSNGWRGEPISWDPAAPVQDDAEYANELREQGAAGVSAFLQRMQLYSNEAELTPDDLETGANMEMVFVEPE